MAIIVLGSHTYEGRPGAVLASRLRKAHDIAARYPTETIVVSGQDEAPVMATWLIDNGIDPARILIEPTATSTNENLERSLALLRSSGHPDPSRGQPFMVVTSDFHKFRTLVWAFRNPNYGADGGNVAAAPPAGFCPGIDGVSALSGSGVVASAGGVVAAAVKNLARRIRHNTSSSVTHKNKIMAGVNAGSG